MVGQKNSRAEQFSGVDQGLPEQRKKFRLAFLPTNETFEGACYFLNGWFKFLLLLKPTCERLDGSLFIG